MRRPTLFGVWLHAVGDFMLIIAVALVAWLLFALVIRGSVAIFRLIGAAL